VLVIPRETAAGLDRRLHDLRDRRLLRGPVRQALEVEIAHGGERVVLLRARDGSWSLGGSAPADDAAVHGLLSMLAELRAERYVSGALERPDARVELALPEETARLLLARREDGAVLASLPGASEVAGVPESAWRSVTRGVEGWRSPTALRVDRARVAAVRISRRGALLVIARDRTGRWEMLAPQPARLNEEAVRRLLVGLTGLAARGYVERPADLARLGLAPPALRISLEDGSGKVLDGLSVGRKVNGGRWAKSVRWAGAFRVEATALGALPTTAEALRGGTGPGRR
jgi:hypothetical protein